MIRITVELWPHGVEARKSTIASADIWNDGSGSPWLGSYGFKLLGKRGRIMRSGRLGEFKRADFSVWWLIAACLRVAFSDVAKTFRDKRVVGRREK